MHTSHDGGYGHTGTVGAFGKRLDCNDNLSVDRMLDLIEAFQIHRVRPVFTLHRRRLAAVAFRKLYMDGNGLQLVEEDLVEVLYWSYMAIVDMRFLLKGFDSANDSDICVCLST